MLYKKIEEYDCPKGLVGVDGEDCVIYNEKTGGILFECEETRLALFCFANDVGRIIGMECESLGENGECISRNGPKDENGNRRCNIITQIKK